MPHVCKQMLSLFLTTKCNLRCIYCYNFDERNRTQEVTLPFDIAKAGVDYFFATNDSRHIRFYGPGEPTQAFDLMKRITEYAKDKAPDRLSVELQTNGVFGQTVKEWLAENANIIWMSFDGPPDIQDVNRPMAGNNPSSHIIEKNTKWLIANKKGKDLMVGARVTVTKKNILRQKEMIDYFLSLGIKHIWSNPLFPSVDKVPVKNDSKKLEAYDFDLDKYVDEYISAYRYGITKGVFYGSFLTCNFDGKSQYHCRACTPVPHVTPDGYLSACDMVVMGKQAYHMSPFIYGEWDAKSKKFILFPEKITALRNRSSENMLHCSHCEAKYNCGGYCLGEVLNETGSLVGQKPLTCQAIRKLLHELGTVSEYEYLHP